MTTLPPGFVLETPAGDIPPLPDGFVLAPPQKSIVEKLGETWPARLAKGIYEGVKSGVTLPADVYAGRAQLPSSGAVPGSVEFGDPASAGTRVADLAGLAAPVNPAIRAGDRALPGVLKATELTRRVPTAEELKAAATASYTAARSTGVEITADSVKNVARAMQAKLEDDGIFATDAPRTFANLERLQSPPPGAFARVEQLESARKAFGHAAGDKNGTERLAASQSIQGMDEFLAAIPAKDVLAGDAAAASRHFERARGNYAAASRSEDVTGAAHRADLNAAVANSGQNLDNATRQRIRDILVSQRDTRGWNAEELAKAETVARGTAPTNAARKVGNFLGGGLGWNAFVTAAVGGATVGPLGLAVPAVGYGVKKVANALTERQVRQLDELLRKRSPLYKEAVPEVSVKSPEKRAAIARILMLSQHPQ